MAEWTSWFFPDGTGYPAEGLLGKYCQFVYRDNSTVEGWVRPPFSLEVNRPDKAKAYTGPFFRTSWDWSARGDAVPIFKYRLQVPKRLVTLLEQASLESLNGTPVLHPSSDS